MNKQSLIMNSSFLHGC